MEAFATACESMARLNRDAARMMHKHGAHGGTDITGFGIKGLPGGGSVGGGVVGDTLDGHSGMTTGTIKVV